MKLLDDGVLPPPDIDALDVFIERQERRIERNAQRGHIPHVQKQIEIEEKKLAAMKKAKDLLYNDTQDEKEDTSKKRKKV
jgi:hypothetical protein